MRLCYISKSEDMIVDCAMIQCLKVEAFDTSSIKDSHVVSYNNKRFEVSTPIAELIKIQQTAESVEDAALQFSAFSGKDYTVKDIENLNSRFISQFFEEGKKTKSVFLFKREIFSSEYVNKTASFFKGMFNRSVFIPLLFIALLLNVHFLIDQRTFLYALSDLDFYSFIGTVLLFVVSSLFHELGHASACKHHGVKPGAIGFGIYINMPVFYADVSSVWTLSRKKRLAVNVGGVYFQLVLLSVACVIYFFEESVVLKYFILFTNVNLLFVLNPLLKFDGYWIVSDLLGVPNLRQRTTESLLNLVKGPFLKKREVNPFLSSISPVTKWIMITYAILVNAFMAFFLFFFLPKFIISYAGEFPDIVCDISRSLSFGIVPFSSLMYFVPRTILVLFFAWFILKAAWGIVVQIKTACFGKGAKVR